MTFIRGKMGSLSAATSILMLRAGCNVKSATTRGEMFT